MSTNKKKKNDINNISRQGEKGGGEGRRGEGETETEHRDKMKEVKLGLIQAVTRANRKNPPSLEEGRGGGRNSN